MKVFLVGQLISFTLIALVFGLLISNGAVITLPFALLLGFVCGAIGTTIAIWAFDDE